MARRRLLEKPEIQVKQFTPEEIDKGVEKLRRRIEQVKSLKPNEVRYDDQIVRNVEFQIRETIRDVFGQSSPEFLRYQYHEIWHGGLSMMDSDIQRQQKFAAGIPQTIKMLEGLISSLEEKRNEAKVDPVARAMAAIESLDLQPRVADVCIHLYQDGHYANAIFDASKALINYVKERSRKYDLDGAPLMRTVFSRNDPILSFNELGDQSDLDEQEGMMHLFEGAVLAIRNPRGHSFLYDSPERALEYIGLLSLLAKRLEEAKRLK
jgi:uncharacterized protein (TIGR02391 family)